MGKKKSFIYFRSGQGGEVKATKENLFSPTLLKKIIIPNARGKKGMLLRQRWTVNCYSLSGELCGNIYEMSTDICSNHLTTGTLSYRNKSIRYKIFDVVRITPGCLPNTLLVGRKRKQSKCPSTVKLTLIHSYHRILCSRFLLYV